MLTFLKIGQFLFSIGQSTTQVLILDYELLAFLEIVTCKE
jgi:hypothetical protein